MSITDILRLSLRNLREARLRATLTTLGVLVGVAVVVTMVSFGLGLQRNTIARFKELDLFNEVTVLGQGLNNLIETGFNKRAGADANTRQPEQRGFGQPAKAPRRILDDAAIAEIAKIPGVTYVEPRISALIYMRANGRVQSQSVGGASVPNESSRFQKLVAGKMIATPESDEAVVNEQWTRDFGYEKPSDAVGQTIEFLAPPKEKPAAKTDEEEEEPNFFGVPLEEDAPAPEPEGRLVAKSFRIVGVLSRETKESPSGGGGFRVTDVNLYIPLPMVRAWAMEYRSPMNEVALQLARESGVLGETQMEGYSSATVRVADVVALTDVRKRLDELGFTSFSIIDQLEQLRTVFLIINSALGLLGGISLLVASFGIANTMIMSILERTREIGIMKAIGAEDREIKLIFFVEAAVIGLAGGVLGSLVAWGIDALANRLAFRFILEPRGASYVDFFALPAYLWLGAILFAVLVSIIAALYPAARAARIDPVRALRHD
ncbi:MAG TPA: ABC transporter permease [Pyrinomonadaceae bacterium]|jgi:ABC-type lipoprotein release transport system permease subunit